LTLNIGLMDVDLLDNGTRHPNLAQMKISSYCKSRGHDTKLLFGTYLNCLDNYDLIVVSKVFDFSKLPPELNHISKLSVNELKKINCDVESTVLQAEKEPEKLISKIIIGGTGFFYNGGIDLSQNVEHIMPDYSLYTEFIDSKIESGTKKEYFKDYINYSIGFTTRGCFRRCSFCVNRKYKECKWHAHITEFMDNNRPKIYLWDDNIFALKEGWEEIFDELIATNKPFQFRQGLDIRLITEGHAEKLSKCKYNGDFIFAFDNIEDKELISTNLALWRKYTKKETKLYVLCAYEPWKSTNCHGREKELQELDIRNTFERINILMKYKCLPYIMRYKTYETAEYRGVYIQLARWCNQPNIFKKMSFREFCEANQKYAKTDRVCAAMRALNQLIESAPDLVEKYCDMKYEDYTWEMIATDME
jgi:hypothetical protein